MRLNNGDEVPLALLQLDKQLFQAQELANCQSVAPTSEINTNFCPALFLNIMQS